jgi:proteasome lid subunit RPN8/RPN11
LPGAVAEEIRRHAAAEYPEEACGALLGEGSGDGATVTIGAALRAENVHAGERERRYLVPPELQLRAEREAQASGRDVVGFYHSHPDHPARPSEHDRAHAWCGYLYLICAVRGGRAEEIGAFALDEPGGEFLELGCNGGW